MANRKLSFDTWLKSLIIFVMMALSVIGIVFGSIRLADTANRGAFYDGTISTTVYFSAYEPTDASGSTKQFDFTKPRSTTATRRIPDVNAMLQQISQTYANRLYAQGFNQVVISTSESTNAQSLVTDNLVNESWLVNGSLPSITLTVNKLHPDKREDLYYTEQVMREITFDINRSYNLSLETTDGFEFFNTSGVSADSDSVIPFITSSAQATTPPATSTDSSITIELNVESGSLNAENAASAYFENQAPGTSDYKVGNGEASVEGNSRLFPANANGETTGGNRNLILWSDKQGALSYVRHIFNVVRNSREFLSFTTEEQNLWNFLHREGTYDGTQESTKTTSLNNAFGSADEITLKDLYYIYAKPSAYQAKSASDTSSPSDVTSASETRTSRGAPNDFSRLFAPYILYEARTLNIDGNQNNMLTDIFPTQQTFSHGGNTKLVLTQILNDQGSYGKVSFSEASRIANLIRSGDFGNQVALIGSDSVANDGIVKDTFASVDAFATSILALGIFVLLVGIIVSVLYKVPGLFAFLPIVLGGVLSLLLYNEFGGVIDLFTMLGLIGMMAVGIGCVLLILETFRRNVRNSTSIAEAIRLAFRHTFMKIVDVHLLLLVIGLLLMYVGHYQESAFGILMVVGSFVSFFVIYGSFTVYVKLFASMQNWTGHGLFVYGRDARWLNQITGQLSQIAVSSADDELHNLFKQTHRNAFFSRKALWALLLWLAAVAVGIASLALFASGSAWPLDSSVRDSGLVMFIAIASSAGIMAVYYSLRYRWVVLLPYLATSLVYFFAVAGTLWALQSLILLDIEFEVVFTMLLGWIVTQAGIAFSISWNYCYWFHYLTYKQESVVKLVNNNAFTMIRLFALYASILPLGALLLAVFNVGGDGLLLATDLNGFLFNLLAFAAAGCALGAIAANYLFTQLLGLMIGLRQKTAQRGKRRRQVLLKQNVDYDRFDEQIIPGINQKFAERQS